MSIERSRLFTFRARATNAKRKFTLLAAVAAVLSFGLLAGCGTSPDQPVPVYGIVLFEGNPLPGAMVVFSPDGGNGPLASGVADDYGKFRLTTRQPNDGALPGNYKVTVTYSDKPSDNPGDFAKAIKGPSKKRPSVVLPMKYATAGQTPFQFTVPTRGEVRLELTKAAR